MKEFEKIKVKVIKKEVESHWYKVGEVYQVDNHISFSWGKDPHFEMSEHSHGIPVDCCYILPSETPEYTKEQLVEIVGHNFKIV